MTTEQADRKRAWQRKNRNDFKAKFGFSTSSKERCGGLRQQVLDRDGNACVKCGMTDEQHRQKWDRPITVDHIDRNRKHNWMTNLQTLCLSCHGRKDLLPQLRIQKVIKFKDSITTARLAGTPFQKIADDLGFSIAAIWKWSKKWNLP